MSGSAKTANRQINEIHSGTNHRQPVFTSGQDDRFSKEQLSTIDHVTAKPNNRNIRATRILTDATRDFGNLKRPSAEQISQYKELFYQMIDRLKASDRRMISAMLARLTFTPRAVALYFAQDQSEIAAPFLLFSNVLGDLDLRAIARKKGRSHAEIIAKRQIPVDAHTKLTIKSIIEQPKKTISNEIELKPSQSPDSKWLNGDEILALASVGGRLGKAASKTVENQIPTYRQTEDLLLPKKETKHLHELARKQDHGGIAAYIEELCGLEAAATLRLIQSEGGNELAYLVKALGLVAPHDIQLILMLTPRIGRNISSYREMKKLLGDLDIGISRMIFNEIGARFEFTKDGALLQQSSSGDSGQNFHDAVRIRRRSLDESAALKPTPRKRRFSFEQSFMATG